MLFLVFALYSLLSLPVQGRAEVFAFGLCGTARIELQAAGLRIVYEKQMTLGKAGWPLHTAPVFTPPQETQKKKKGRASRLRRILVSCVRRAAAPEQIDAAARIGAGDAMHTALAAGAAHAALLAALGAGRAPRHTRVAVVPDFASHVFVLRLRCIFSVTVGDIMLSAASAAMKRRRKEGTRWSSIPLRT